MLGMVLGNVFYGTPFLHLKNALLPMNINVENSLLYYFYACLETYPVVFLSAPE